MHKNEAHCDACDGIFNRYPNFHLGLRSWFDAVRISHPELHCSEAGRGKLVQEKAFKNGTSKAHYGQSPHNFNLACDVWINLPGKMYDKNLFDEIVGKNLIPQITWFGSPGSSFKELPHLQWRDWKNVCHLVE